MCLLCLLCFQEPPLSPSSQHQQPGTFEEMPSLPQLSGFIMVERVTGGASKTSLVYLLAAVAGNGWGWMLQWVVLRVGREPGLSEGRAKAETEDSGVGWQHGRWCESLLVVVLGSRHAVKLNSHELVSWWVSISQDVLWREVLGGHLWCPCPGLVLVKRLQKQNKHSYFGLFSK